ICYYSVAAEKTLQFDNVVLQNLKSSSDIRTTTSFLDTELYSEYQCAIECVKQYSCTSYFYISQTKVCSLFDNDNVQVNEKVKEWRAQLPRNTCDTKKCKPGAVCIENKNMNQAATCVCLNGRSTTEDCDKIVVGKFADWSEWKSCSVTCGEGYRSRKRQCLQDGVETLTHNCIGKDLEIQPCNITTCPMYGPWSSWTPCSTFCGIGSKQRNRSCVPPGSNCGNYTSEQRACGEANCQRVAGIKQTEPEKYPLKGYLSIREGDILCVGSIDAKMAKHMADLVCKSIGLPRGAQYAVLNQIKYNSTCYPGIICDGSENDFYECKYDRSQAGKNISELFAIVARCIVDGGYSEWTPWSPCTKSCGTGYQNRSRTCTDPPPSIPEISDDSSLAGYNCTGEYSQLKPCNTQSCKAKT
ncbi:unnamed protein product, partial [Didymodactylos carnosus]